MAKVLRVISTAAIGGALLAALATQVWAVRGKEGSSIAPHRAVYEIRLDRASPGSGVADMTGRMVYEMSGSSCKGYE
ncbi:MAG: EipB family protein, partial [Hyphomicrobium sp.]